MRAYMVTVLSRLHRSSVSACPLPNKSSYRSSCTFAVCHLCCYVQIDDLNLLIFDECHGAIKRDPFNCIMQELYHNPKNKVCAAESFENDCIH